MNVKLLVIACASCIGIMGLCTIFMILGVLSKAMDNTPTVRTTPVRSITKVAPKPLKELSGHWVESSGKVTWIISVSRLDKKYIGNLIWRIPTREDIHHIEFYDDNTFKMVVLRDWWGTYQLTDDKLVIKTSTSWSTKKIMQKNPTRIIDWVFTRDPNPPTNP